MENIYYTSSAKSVMGYIEDLNKDYDIWIDFKDEIKYIDPNGYTISQSSLEPVNITHTLINPYYKIYKKNTYGCVVKVIIHTFTLTFPKLHNISYTFNENSLDIYINLVDFTIQYSDIDNFFDNGIKSYLTRTINSILSHEFVSDNNYSIISENYEVYINSKNRYTKKHNKRIRNN